MVFRKGQATDQDKAKRAFLDEWVKAVNEHGGFGRWVWAVSRRPGDVVQILEQASSARSIANGNGHSL
ncbi:MAG TPA: hypothetical protein VFS84_07665 [Candidatus Binatia bacterium]|nr:hypothetical protein [Candidatus Binatia bacterium]